MINFYNLFTLKGFAKFEVSNIAMQSDCQEKNPLTGNPESSDHDVSSRLVAEFAMGYLDWANEAELMQRDSNFVPRRFAPLYSMTCS